MSVMFSSPPARHSGHGNGRHPANRWAIVAILTLGVAAPMSACHPAEQPSRGDDVAGPGWSTEVRRSPGAATQAVPAALTGLSIHDYDVYDRVVFDFDGGRPGYRVAYEDRAGRSVLRVTITHIAGSADRRLAPEDEAVREVIQHPAQDLVIETVVELAAGEADGRLPFRVGLDVGEFYVDISHPNEVVARRQ